MRIPINLASQPFRRDRPVVVGAVVLSMLLTGLLVLLITLAVKEKRQLADKVQAVSRLDQSLRAQGVQIFIGHESGYQILDDCSIVTAPYGSDDTVVGVLGVIGPTRMAYERIIPIVDMTAKILGAALNSRR